MVDFVRFTEKVMAPGFLQGSGTQVPLSGTTVADSTVSNTKAETAFTTGQITLPANILQPTVTYRFSGKGEIVGNATHTARIRVRLGTTALAGTVVLDGGAVAIGGGGSGYMFEGEFTVRAIGAAGVLEGKGWIDQALPAALAPVYAEIDGFAIDTTVANILAVTIEFSAAATGNIGTHQYLSFGGIAVDGAVP